MTAAKTQRVASRQRRALFQEHLFQRVTGTWLRPKPFGFFWCCAKKTSRQLVCVGENESPKRPRKEKAPGRHVVPGGQRTSHLFRERLDGCTTQLPCRADSPGSISSNHTVDAAFVSLHANSFRSAARRNVVGTFPMQTHPRGCFTSIPICDKKIGKFELADHLPSCSLIRIDEAGEYDILGNRSSAVFLGTDAEKRQEIKTFHSLSGSRCDNLRASA